MAYGSDREELDSTELVSEPVARVVPVVPLVPVVPVAREGCWPCDECECTYPLQQMLELHKKQKHRERTVSCDQCDA